MNAFARAPPVSLFFCSFELILMSGTDSRCLFMSMLVCVFTPWHCTVLAPSSWVESRPCTLQGVWAFLSCFFNSVACRGVKAHRCRGYIVSVFFKMSTGSGQAVLVVRQCSPDQNRQCESIVQRPLHRSLSAFSRPRTRSDPPHFACLACVQLCGGGVK